MAQRDGFGLGFILGPLIVSLSLGLLEIWRSRIDLEKPPPGQAPSV